MYFLELLILICLMPFLLFKSESRRETAGSLTSAVNLILPVMGLHFMGGFKLYFTVLKSSCLTVLHSQSCCRVSWSWCKALCIDEYLVPLSLCAEVHRKIILSLLGQGYLLTA